MQTSHLMRAPISMRRLAIAAFSIAAAATYIVVEFFIEGEQDHPPPEPGLREKALLWPFLVIRWLRPDSLFLAFSTVSLLYTVQNLMLFLCVRVGVACLLSKIRPLTTSELQAERWTCGTALVALWTLFSAVAGLASWLGPFAAAAVLYICGISFTKTSSAPVAEDSAFDVRKDDDEK